MNVFPFQISSHVVFFCILSSSEKICVFLCMKAKIGKNFGIGIEGSLGRSSRNTSLVCTPTILFTNQHCDRKRAQLWLMFLMDWWQFSSGRLSWSLEKWNMRWNMKFPFHRAHTVAGGGWSSTSEQRPGMKTDGFWWPSTTKCPQNIGPSAWKLESFFFIVFTPLRLSLREGFRKQSVSAWQPFPDLDQPATKYQMVTLWSIGGKILQCAIVALNKIGLLIHCQPSDYLWNRFKKESVAWGESVCRNRFH